MAAIGVFDSGYGGLTILKNMQDLLPQYDYLYLGDNARAPYGNRSFDAVYHYTWEAVQWFFKQGCPLVVLACNTASAKALRSIQQKNLPMLEDQSLRVLGVIRPTSEVIGSYSKTNHIGILATKGTVVSESYVIEIKKFFPDTTVSQQACPIWVPLIENNEYLTPGGEWFIARDLDRFIQSTPGLDTILLGCTHYPLLKPILEKYAPPHIKIVSQGDIVADSLKAYLQRHAAVENKLSKGGTANFYTTDSITDFNEKASFFYGASIESKHAEIQLA